MNIGNETETIEFKKTTSETKEGIISISSILNKHGMGTLYFGVKDNGDVVGQDIGKDTLRFLSRDISRNINPACWYEISVKHTSDGKSFIEIQFNGNNAPYSAFGKYYERFADEDRAISDSELEKLFKLRQKDHSAWEQETSNSIIADVNEKLLKELIKRGIETGRISYEFKDTKTILSKFGLIANDNKHLTNAGKFLFSKKSPIVLKLATFATNTKETFTKLNHFEGNIFECIEEAAQYIIDSISWNIYFNGKTTRKEQPEIPVSAIREIVINAFAHGDYSSNTTFEIDVFRSKVTIYSPGHFPFGFIPEDFANKAEEPVMLNPKIVNVLFKTALIESFGTGFERTFKECKNAGVKYSYENTKSGFRFTFNRPLGQNNVQDMNSKMSKVEIAVLEVIKANNASTAKQISERIGKSEKTVYRAIKSLKLYGYISRKGNDFDGIWVVNDQFSDSE